ncbi:MAG: hypothetical protein ACRCX2_18465 [Paraclostridium sp.]
MHGKLESLFSGIRHDTVLEQGSTAWLNERKLRLTSSDIVPAILYTAFFDKDPFSNIYKLLQSKNSDEKPDEFVRNKYRLGHIFEKNIIDQMKKNDKFSIVSASPILICDKFIVSMDGICLLKNEIDDGIKRYTVYEIKYTQSQSIFNAIKDSDMTSVYYKKYSLQLAFHMLATYYYLSQEMDASKFELDGVLICGIGNSNGSIEYARFRIENISSFFCCVILQHSKNLLKLYDDMIVKKIEPFAFKNKNVVAHKNNNVPDDSLNDMMVDYNDLYNQKLIIEEKMRIIDGVIVGKMLDQSISEHIVGNRRFYILESTRTKKEKKDIAGADEEIKNINEQIDNLQNKLNLFYDVSIKHEKVLKIKEITRKNNG